MATLHQNWLTEGWIDIEYKKYLLLAYLQEAGTHFSEKKLFPKLSELSDHYRNLIVFRDQKKAIVNDFPKEISKLDFDKFRLEYREMFDDIDLIKEIDAIIDFALPEIEKSLELGKELYEEVEDKVELYPIGIQPLRVDEGYFFLSDFIKKLVSVYQYQISIFENMQEKFRGIKVDHLYSYTANVGQTYESMKYKLVTSNTMLPNPATYAIEFKQSFPLPETMLPIAKRFLVRHISLTQ